MFNTMSNKRIRSFFVFGILGICLSLFIPQMSSASDSQIEAAVIAEVSEGLSNTAPTPSVTNISSSSGYALATWNLGDMGGQALLEQSGSDWVVIASGGGAMDASTLEGYGVPAGVAAELSPF